MLFYLAKGVTDLQICAKIKNNTICEVWVVLDELAYDKAWNEEKHPRDAKGQFTSGHGKTKSNVSRKEFCDTLKEAKKSLPPDKAWRVSTQTPESLKKEHKNAVLHKMGKSTIAIDNGDIIAVCRHIDDISKGTKEQRYSSKMLEWAVNHGGVKLDSYSGNHEFYVSNGFEPISWCEFDKNFAPPDWDEKRDKPEPIIFYRYIGNDPEKKKEIMKKFPKPKDFVNSIPKSKDYFAAQQERDKVLENEKENRVDKN